MPAQPRRLAPCFGLGEESDERGRFGGPPTTSSGNTTNNVSRLWGPISSRHVTCFADVSLPEQHRHCQPQQCRGLKEWCELISNLSVQNIFGPPSPIHEPSCWLTRTLQHRGAPWLLCSPDTPPTKHTRTSANSLVVRRLKQTATTTSARGGGGRGKKRRRRNRTLNRCAVKNSMGLLRQTSNSCRCGFGSAKRNPSTTATDPPSVGPPVRGLRMLDPRVPDGPSAFDLTGM